MIPRITVITPSFNQAATLERTIRSVLDQGYPDLEYLVYDGGSDDGSVAIIERYAERIDHWASEQDRGQSHAINRGLKRASGSILCWLNSDDAFRPGALATVVDRIGDQVAPCWLVGGCEIIESGKNGDLVPRVPTAIGARTFLNWGVDWFPQQSTFWTRDMLAEVGYLDESLHFAMDLDFWTRMYRVADPIVIDSILSEYHLHEEAKCVRDPGAARRERLAVARRFLVESFARPGSDRMIRLQKEIAAAYLEMMDEMERTHRERNQLASRLQWLRGHAVLGRLIRAWGLVNRDVADLVNEPVSTKGGRRGESV
jgi:glycosyltransferase involved in cell wall biosynthesis